MADAIPAPPPVPTVDMVDQSGQVVAVPHDQAAQAYASGQLGFIKGQQVQVVGAGGTVGSVDAEHAGQVLSRGGRLASPEEYRAAELDNKYGGIIGHGAAFAEGGARGLTLGLSDPLAVGLAEAVGGKETGEKVRQHLAEEQEAHPYLSTGGELVGAALPAILSGGTTAEATAGEVAARGGAEALGAATEGETMARIAEGVRTLGVLPRAVSGAGEVAERAIGSVLGAEGKTLVGRAAQAAAKGAIRGIVEGGLFGAGQEISDATLQDHELTGEKLLSAVGHGALMGGLLGGTLSGTGKALAEGATSFLGKLSPGLDDAAGEQAWKWLDPLKGLSEKAERQAGGTDAVGRTVFDEVLKPLVEEKGLMGAAISNEEKLELVQKALQRKGTEIGSLVEGHSAASVPLADMLKPIDERIEEWAGKVGGEDKVAALQKLRDSVTRVLGEDTAAAEPIESKLEGMVRGSPEFEKALADAGYVKRSPGELAEHLKANPDILGREGPLPIEATHKAPAVAPIAEGKTVAIKDAIEQRRALQQIAYQESKSLDPKMRVQILRDVAGAWNGLEEKALNAASKSAGDGAAGTQLRALNKTYQQLKLAEEALERNNARIASNNTFSLGDKMFAASTLAGGLASAHPASALAAPVMAMGHKFLRAHGNAYAALVLDRLSAMGGASKAVAEFDGAVDGAIGRILSGKAGRAARAANDTGGRFEQELERVKQLAAMSPGLIGAHLQQRTAPLETHLPRVASAMQSQAKAATAFLTSKLPPDRAAEQPSLTPQLNKATYAANEKKTLLRAVDAVEGGPEAILNRIAAGKQTPEDMEALEKVWPKAFAEIQQKLMRACADRKSPLPYQTRLKLGALFKMPADPSMKPEVIRGIQESYAAHPTAPSSDQTGAPAPARRAPSSLKVSRAMATPFESARGGA